MARARTYQWLGEASSDMAPTAQNIFFLGNRMPEKVPPSAIKFYEDRLVTQFRAADDQLARTPYLTGNEITVADLGLYPIYCRAQGADRWRRPPKCHRLGRPGRGAAGGAKGHETRALSGEVTLFDLSGRVAVVTGGNGGIGLGMAKGLAAAGASVAVAARNAEKGEAAVATLCRVGRQERLHRARCRRRGLVPGDDR